MDFQGFQNSIPAFIAILIAAGLVALAFYSYQKQKNLAPPRKLLLGGLRALSFLIIFLMVLNPYFFSSKVVEKKPQIMVMLDNSSSMGIEKGEYQGLESYRDMLVDLNLDNFNEADFEYFTIGSSTTQIPNPDSLNHLEGETNFISAIAQIRELEDDYDAVILASDGIITFGRNPIIQASELGIPLYTIGLGDTSSVRDIIINNISTNATGYTNYRQPVEIEVAQKGFNNTTTEVELRNSSGEILDSQSITFRNEAEIRTLNFELNLEQEGIQQYSVVVQPQPGEWTEENNRSSFSVEVLDSKTRVLHYGFEIHPDVKMLRSVLLEDQNVELTTKTWLGGTRYVEEEPVDFSDFDLIIYHGLPRGNTPLPQPQNIQVPTFYLELPGTRQYSSSFEDIALIENSGAQLFELSLAPQADNTDHPIMELPEISYEVLAPVFSSLRSRLLQADAQILFNTSFQGVVTPNPVIAVVERGGLRKVDVAAWNWHRLYQSNSQEEREFVSTLFSNMVAWVSNDPDDRRLKINLAKPVFSISDPVIINGDLINESGDAESSATIEVSLTTDEEQRIFNMDNLGSGRYKMELESLGPGVYSFDATARKGDRVIDEQSGEFVVENTNTELINTIRNDELLKALADETGGKSYSFNAVNGLWGDLEDAGVLEAKTETVESYHFPVRNFPWFALVLLLLGAEWLLRKGSSLP